ncbi:MAG: hypothetical protein S4CHLAM7_09000 [Chlamydiae bacterium]|nr:hypothetical protein [Chlamydiota bacterium]
MSTIDRASSSSSRDDSSQRSRPTAVHYHTNQPVVYPYKPGDKPPPPGAHLYRDIWMIFKVATQIFLCGANPSVYSAGFLAGMIKAGYECSEIGPPKKIFSDDEMIEFGATAHSSTWRTQLSVMAENILAVVVPVKAKDWFPNQKNIRIDNPALSEELNDFIDKKTKSVIPSNAAEYVTFGFTAYHSVLAGEEVVQRIVKWIDQPAPKK